MLVEAAAAEDDAAVGRGDLRGCAGVEAVTGRVVDEPVAVGVRKALARLEEPVAVGIGGAALRVDGARGVEAEAVTLGRGWIAVVSQDNRILIFDRETGDLRQEVQIRR